MIKLKKLLKEEGWMPTGHNDAVKTTYDKTGGRIELKKTLNLPFKFDRVAAGSDIVEFSNKGLVVANLDKKTGKIYY